MKHRTMAVAPLLLLTAALGLSTVRGQQPSTPPSAAAGEAPKADAPTPDQTYAALAKQVRNGDCAGALPQLETFTKENPAHAHGLYLVGYCNAVQGNKDDAALAALTKSQELDPTFAGVSTLIGKIQVRNKRLPEAEAAFKKELEGTSVAPAVQFDALMNLGAVQRDQNKADDAIATFEKAMTVSPTRPEPYIEQSALYTKAGQNDKAEAVLDKAKAAGADDPVALLNVGIAYYNKKDYEHAESMFRRVTASKAGNKDLAMAYNLLGTLQAKNSKNTEAVESFKKSLELEPEGGLAAKNKEALKTLEPKPKPKKK